MKRQRGQSAVEFALMAPMVFLLIFGAIYGGIMFINFMNFSNEARTVARQISVSTQSERQTILSNYNEQSGGRTFATFYNVTMTAFIVDKDNNVVDVTDTDNARDVVVDVNFERDNEDLPLVVYVVDFPPESFKLEYRMRLERTSTVTTTTTTTEDTTTTTTDTEQGG